MANALVSPKFVCTICARGGSKGVPGKNIRMLIDKPLIAHTIAQAKATGLFEAVAVSSDSPEILEVAGQYGADILIRRPDELATDESGKLPAILHALGEVEHQLGFEADYLIDLDATSPLRFPEDITACADILTDTGCSCVLTGYPAHRSPYFNLLERAKDGSISLSKQLPDPVLRRQDSPECFDMNGSVYGWKREALRADPGIFYPDTKLYVMPRDRSIDVDEELDFDIIRMIMERRARN